MVGIPLREGTWRLLKVRQKWALKRLILFRFPQEFPASTEGRDVIPKTDIKWVVNSGQYSRRPEKKIPSRPQGVWSTVLLFTAQHGHGAGGVECNAIPAPRGEGKLTVTGMVEEEEIDGGGRTVRRKSMAKSSWKTFSTVLRRFMEVDL